MLTIASHPGAALTLEREDTMKTMYMNPKTGSVDERDGWWYENGDWVEA